MSDFRRKGYVRTVITLGMLALAAVAARPHNALAATITLESSAGGVYDYGVVLAVSEFLDFVPGDTITISGLSGVTGQSVDGDLSLHDFFVVSSFTSTSATFAYGLNVDGSLENSTTNTETQGDFVIDSSVLTTGAANYTVVSSNDGTLTGTVQGPVSSTAVPEPASLSILGMALAGLGLIRRRKRVS